VRGVKQNPQPPMKMPRGVNHGTSGYKYGCRCEKCITAQREAYRRYLARKKAGLVKPQCETEAEYRVKRLLEAASSPFQIEIDGEVVRFDGAEISKTEGETRR